MRVLVLHEEVEGRVEQRTRHRRHREQPGRDELVVAHGVAADFEIADERADADTDREQEQHRLGETGAEHEPHAPVGEHVAFDDARREAGRDHAASRRVNVRVPAYQPAATHADEHARRARTTRAVRGRRSSPIARARRRATAARGTASGSSQSGSSETGKNVPENRNSGRIPSRMITGNAKSVSCVDRERGKRRAERGGGQRRRPGSRARPRRRDRAEHARRPRGRPSRRTCVRIAFQITKPPNTSRGADRCRDDAVVEAQPLHARDHRPQRLAGRELHRARDHQARARRSRGTRPRRRSPSSRR